MLLPGLRQTRGASLDVETRFLHIQVIDAMSGEELATYQADSLAELDRIPTDSLLGIIVPSHDDQLIAGVQSGSKAFLLLERSSQKPILHGKTDSWIFTPPIFSQDKAERGTSVLKSLVELMNETPQVMLADEAADVTQEPCVLPNMARSLEADPNCRYRLDGEIARGGMGAIIRGRDNDLGRDLAVKVLFDSHKGKPEVVQRFVEEAQIGGQLQHPGIAPVYELGQFSDQRPFFTMKLVKGKTLAALLADRDDELDHTLARMGETKHVCKRCEQT